MSAADKIREKRLSAGLSMTDLANKLGVSTSAVSNWEAGKTTPRSDAFHKLAKIFRTTEAILRDEDEGSPVNPIAPPGPTGGVVQTILDDARTQLANALGVHPEAISLQFNLNVKI